jgi:hypothetical protein
VTPSSYAPHNLDHVLACGLQHFFGALNPLFESAVTVIQPSGVFAFTTKVPPLRSASAVRAHSGGIPVCMHRVADVVELAAVCWFEVKS